MKFILTASLLISCSSLALPAQEPELRWGEFGVFSNWDRYPYAIKSSYPFIGKLPDLREFPKLIALALDPKLPQEDRRIVLSQMRTLSRCDFEKTIQERSNDPGADLRAVMPQWQAWWKHYGEGLAQSLPKTGHRDEAAWKAVAPSPYLECPKYPISIPKHWSTTLSFRSGDYGAMTEEVIELHVNETQCELRRRYRTGYPNQWTWTHEIWTDFTPQEADHLLAVLIYAIDNPWFFAGDELSAPIDKKGMKMHHIRGRPKEWLNYYPSYEWSGILDAGQQVLINHDPWHWDSIDYKMSEKTSLDGGAFGLVFRVFRDLFPDPSWAPRLSRWKKTDPPAGWKEPDDAARPATAAKVKTEAKGGSSAKTRKQGR